MTPGAAPGGPERRDRRAGEGVPLRAPSGERSSAARSRAGDGTARRGGWRHREIALAAGVALAALAVRVPFLSHKSFDYRHFYSIWYDFIVANGYAASWSYEFANYNPPYLYLLTAAAYFAPAAPKLLAIKALSNAGDFVLAYFAYRAVGLRYRESRGIPILAAGAVLLAPTVVVNSSRLGQADALYTAFLMACLHGLLAGWRARALVAFGLAFAVKLQAVFLAPLLYWLWARKALAARYFALVPPVFLLAFVPAALAGRPALDLLSIYLDQIRSVRELHYGAPNLYAWIPDDYYLFWPAGVALTAALVEGVRRLLAGGRPEMTRETVVFLALFSALLTPFFLPKMMNRYFFPADVFAIVLAFYRPRLWYIPIGVGLASLSTYPVFPSAIRETTLGWSAALLALILADLTRRLLAASGRRPGLSSAAAGVSRFVRRRRAAAAPLLLLSLAFVALFAAFARDGNLDRPLANEGTSAKTLARAVGLPPDEGPPASPEADRSVPFRGESFDEPSALPGGRTVFDRALAAVLSRFGDDLSAQLAAARSLMLALFCGAALLAYFSLCRVLAFRRPSRRASNRWIALSATLFAFGSGAAASADTVAVEGAPAAFGGFLLFHGMAVFCGEGRFRQLLVKTGAALLLGWGACLLLAPFVGLGLWAERRRRAGRGETGTGEASAGWLGPLPAGSLPGPVGSPFLALGLFSLAFGAVSLGAGGGPAVPAPAGGAPGGEFLAAGFSTLGRGVLPYAALGRVPPAGGGAADAILFSVGVAVAAASVAGAVMTRSLPLLALVLSALGSALWFGGGSFPGGAALSALGAPLAGAALGVSAARRVFGSPVAGVAAGLSAAVWAMSFWAMSFWAMSFSPPGAAPGVAGAGEGEAREAGRRLREDFSRIRQALRESTLSPPISTGTPPDLSRIRQALRERPAGTVFLAPLSVGDGEVPGGARAAFFLGGFRWTADPAERGDAEWLVGEASPGGGSPGPRRRGGVTPGGEAASLYHRATHDGEVDALLAASPPRVRSEFDVHLVDFPSGGKWLVFASDGCPEEVFDGLLIVHLVPEEPDDLSLARRLHGFDNRSFQFAHRAIEIGERCVARRRFPTWPVRSVVVGRSARPPGGGGYESRWRAEFAPSDLPASEVRPPPPKPGARVRR